MIWLYTGTPGSGKSYHAAKDIIRRIKLGGGLICNFPVNTDIVKRPKSKVVYWDNSELSPGKFAEYAFANHKLGREGQTLVVIDEAQIIFNCRDFGAKDRNKWVELFAQHRKLGFDFILITQNDRMLDKQIRALCEYQVKHRKANNYGFGGLLLSVTGMTWFVAIDYWYGMQGKDARLGCTMFPYIGKYSKIYDSYKMFSEWLPAGAGGNRASGGALGEAGGLSGEQKKLPVCQDITCLEVTT